MTQSRNDLRNASHIAAELEVDASNGRLTAEGEKTDAGGGHETRRQFAELRRDEIDRIPVLKPGAHLEQGGVYLDLDDTESGPFVAIGHEAVVEGDRLVAKRDADHEIWNRLVGDRRARTLRPI